MFFIKLGPVFVTKMRVISPPVPQGVALYYSCGDGSGKIMDQLLLVRDKLSGYTALFLGSGKGTQHRSYREGGTDCSAGPLIRCGAVQPLPPAHCSQLAAWMSSP
ncbi:unnamed protein product [Natator depressus]